MKADLTEVIAGANPDDLFAHLAVLERYPPWMRLVHSAVRLSDDDADPGGRPAWWVELRARVGPFTRSKQLRMVRTEFGVGELARFERVELDGREHAEWSLTASVAAADGGAAMRMQLAYGGDLWSAGVLGRILDDEVRRATRALTDLLATPAADQLTDRGR